MSFQSVIDNATNITMDAMPMSSAVLTRSNRLKTATRGEAIYKFNIETSRPFIMNGINRAFLQVLQTLGRTTEQEVTLSNTANMGYIMGYAGTLDNTQLNALTITSYTGSTFVVDTSATLGILAGDTMFEVGDYIQPANSRYTYQVRTAVFGSDIVTGSVNVLVNRNIYTSASDGGNNIVGQAFNVANNCSFRVKCLNLPSYTLHPGKYFQFDGDFQFVEVIL